MNSAAQTAGDLAASQSLMNRFARKPSQKSASQAAGDFEGMFMTQMLQPMFDTVGVDPMFGGGHGEEMMRGFLVQEYGKIVAKNSHLGIAQAVQGELERAQQAQQKANAKTTTQQYGAAYAAGQIQ